MSAHAIAIYILYVLWWPLNAPSRFGACVLVRLSRRVYPVRLLRCAVGEGYRIRRISIGLVFRRRAQRDRRGAMCIRRVVPVEFGGVRFSSARQAVWNDDRIACRIVSNLIVTKTKLGVTN